MTNHSASSRSGTRRPATTSCSAAYDSDVRDTRPRHRRASPPRCCSPTPTCSAPGRHVELAVRFRASASGVGVTDPAHDLRRRACPQPLARRLLRDDRRSGASASRSCRSPPASTTSVAEIEAAAGLGLQGHHDPDPLVRRSRRTTDPSYDPVWAACADDRTRRCTRTPARARPTTTSAPASCRSTRPRRGGGRRGRCGCCCCRACSNATRRCSTRSPRTARGGCPTSSSAWTRSGSAATTPASSATCSSRTCR